MALDWLNQPLDTAVSDLIARKKRAKAIELLRSQLMGRMAPAVTTRLQLCDLLIQAGREQEAVPILIGLADEFAGDGFVAKAIAILKRVEKIDPGPHVDSRLEKLVRQQRVTLSGTPSAAPLLGMEEFGDEPMPGPEDVVATLPEGTAEGPVEVPTAIGAADLAAADERTVEYPPPPEPMAYLEAAEEFSRRAAEDAEPTTPVATADVVPAAEVVAEALEAVGPVVEATVEPPVETPVSEPAAPPPVAAAAAEPGVARRIRGAFRRFLASLGPEETAEASAAAAPVEAPPVAEPVAAEPTPDVAPVVGSEESEALATEAEPVVAEAEPQAAEPEPEALAAEPEPLAAEPIVDADDMPEAEFQEALLDLVSEVLQRPRGVPVASEQVATYAQRLLATELFGSLAEDELLAVVRELKLHTYDPGDVVVTEHEPGRSLFVLTAGEVRVYVLNPSGRSFEVARLGEGDFFGEMSILSGRPRAATVVAATLVEALELDRAALDAIAGRHPRVAAVLEQSYIRRASQPEAAAVRAVPLEATDARKAIEALEAFFGETRWDPRMRLRLADVLARAGKDGEAIPILVGLADDLAREGFPEKAVAILKKIEQLQRRNQEFVSLAPLHPSRPAAASKIGRKKPAPLPDDPAPGWLGKTDDRLSTWLLDVVRDNVRRTADRLLPASGDLRGYTPGLLASPLFADFDEDELLALIQGLRLLTFEPGEIVVSEGEPGDSVFILSSGTVRVFVRDAKGRSAFVCTLNDGSFFGEMSALSGKPRSATVTAAWHCELLELDRATLDRIGADHPRVREVLAEFSAHRASDPAAQALRTETPPA